MNPNVGASSVCAKECATGVSRGNLGILSFASSLGDVREKLPTASDVPGSLFWELVNLTREVRAPLVPDA